MTKRKFNLNENQVQELKHHEQQSQRVAELKRLQAVRLYGSGRSVQDIQDIVGCSESSVRQWVGKYKQAGMSGLLAQYEKSAQNARKLSKEQEEDLRDKLHFYRPHQVLATDDYHGSGQFWRVEDVQQVVVKWYGVSYKARASYRNLLHRCGFSYQRSEQLYKSRPSERDIADFEAELEKN